jgi:hypothetical protein
VVGGSWNDVDTITFSVGSSTVTLTYGVVDDGDSEGDETLGFSVSSGGGYAIDSPATATATIADDDAPPVLPTVTVTAVSGGEGDGSVVVTFARTGSTSGALTIDVTRSGTATPAGDPDPDLAVPPATGGTWKSALGEIAFDAGSSTVVLTFDVVDDGLSEGDESLTFTVDPDVGYVLGAPSTATATITDNEPAVDALLSINSTSVTESDSGRPTVFVTLTVTRTGNLAGTTTVDWTTVDGTALQGSDYVAGGGTLTFDPGETTQTITIEIGADKQGEPTETFTVVLSGASDDTVTVVVPNDTGVVTIIDDDNKLRVAMLPAGTGFVAPIDVTTANSTLALAIDEWLLAGADPTVLTGLSVSIGHLPADALAETFGSAIVIDADAAGWGWEAIDLRSVLLHELGHVLGFEHTDHGLMAAFIRPGDALLPPGDGTPPSARVWPVTPIEMTAVAETADAPVFRLGAMVVAAAGNVHPIELVPPVVTVTRLVETGALLAGGEYVFVDLPAAYEPVACGLADRVGGAISRAASIAASATADATTGTSRSALPVVLLVALVALVPPRRRRPVAA